MPIDSRIYGPRGIPSDSIRAEPALADEVVAGSLAKMAEMIKSSISELNAIGLIASVKSRQQLPETKSETEIKTTIRPQDHTTFQPNGESIEDDIVYNITEINPKDKRETGRSLYSYCVYTKRFDEIIEAEALVDQAELSTLYNYISKASVDLKRHYEATLIAKLARYRSKINWPLAVTILIDNAGSLRGENIVSVAGWCLFINEWLDRLGIDTEFLGYTTRAWKGGQSRELWLSNGKPANPGRLNDLRHIVFKSFSGDAGVSAPNFGVMAKEGLLKENIDGEALLWAASRLQNHPAQKKILFVFSDGAPVDDSTLSVNPGKFLEEHLLAVISTLSTRVPLYAVGIGHDVSRYYRGAITAKGPSDLGARFFETLINDSTFLECVK
jgi:cobaltochelatase CobT